MAGNISQKMGKIPLPCLIAGGYPQLVGQIHESTILMWVIAGGYSMLHQSTWITRHSDQMPT